LSSINDVEVAAAAIRLENMLREFTPATWEATANHMLLEAYAIRREWEISPKTKPKLKVLLESLAAHIKGSEEICDAKAVTAFAGSSLDGNFKKAVIWFQLGGSVSRMADRIQ
jgi:hypothetical protein